MAAMTWTTLTGDKNTAGSIRRWINWDKIDPEEIIAEGEDWMALFLRTSLMQKRVDTADALVLAEGDSSIDLAAELDDFLDPLMFFLVGYGRLSYVAQDEFDTMRWPDADDLSLNSGTPSRFGIVGRTMYFDVAADQEYKIIGQYYGKPTPLSADNQTSIYTTDYRLIFKNALLGSAYQLPKDAAMQDAHYKKALGMISQQKVMDDLMLRAQQQYNRVSD